MRRTITFAFIVILGAASVAYTAPPAAAGGGGPGARRARIDPPDRMICRRFVWIGTLAGSDRVCKTRADWDRDHENARGFNMSNSCHLNQASDVPANCPQ